MIKESQEEMPDGGTPINFAMLFYVHLSKLRGIKDSALIRGDVEGYHKALHAIYLSIAFKLSAADKKKIKENLDKSADYLSTGVKGAMQARVAQLTRGSAYHILTEIDEELMELMNKHHMIFPKIDMKGLALIDKRFGLGGP